MLPVLRGSLLTALLTALLCGCGPRFSAETLLILGSGHTQGYLENCGCSGGQIGGLARRSAYIRQARDSAAKGEAGEPDQHHTAPGSAATGANPSGNPNASGEEAKTRPLRVDTLLIDCGGFSQRGDGFREIESGGVVEAMGLLDYDAVGLGQSDIEYEQPKLLELLGQAKLPYTCANLRFTAPEKGADQSAALNALLRPYLVVRKPSGLRIGIVHVIDINGVYREGRLKSGYTLGEPLEAARNTLAAHEREADLWVLSVNCMKFTQLDPVTVAAIPGVDIVFGLDVAAIQSQREHDRRLRQTDPRAVPLPSESAPPAAPAGPPGAYQMGRPMEKGKNMLALAWPLHPAKGRPPPQPWTIYIKEGPAPDARIEAISQSLQPRREAYELTLAQQAVDLRKQNREHPWYLGQAVCAQCHGDIAAKLAPSKHMQAYQTLVGKGKQATSCAKCHTLGYNRPSGWNAIEDRDKAQWDLRGVQCENCHGPGEYHVLLQQGQPAPEDLLRRGRDGQGLIPASAATCVQCHDHENSPHFQFITFWPRIVHGPASGQR